MKEYIAAVHIMTHGADNYNSLFRFTSEHELIQQIRNRLYGQLSAICYLWITIEGDEEGYGRELKQKIVEMANDEYDIEYGIERDDD